VYGIAICVNSNSTTSQLRDALLDVGVDPTAGTSYSVVMPYLLCSAAPTLNVGTNVIWYFPLFIKAGSSIAVRASVNNATVGTLICYARLYGKPSNPEVTQVGTYVRQFGAVTATSRGTAVTSGTTSEGAWTQLGSSTTDVLWYWKIGMGIADATLGGVLYFVDLAYGDASNKIIICEDLHICANSAEFITYNQIEADAYCTVPIGSNIYGRIQCSGTSDTTPSLIAYGMGG
jgi:hypothetical protein